MIDSLYTAVHVRLNLTYSFSQINQETDGVKVSQAADVKFQDTECDTRSVQIELSGDVCIASIAVSVVEFITALAVAVANPHLARYVDVVGTPDTATFVPFGILDVRNFIGYWVISSGNTTYFAPFSPVSSSIPSSRVTCSIMVVSAYVNGLNLDI